MYDSIFRSQIYKQHRNQPQKYRIYMNDHQQIPTDQPSTVQSTQKLEQFILQSLPINLTNSPHNNADNQNFASITSRQSLQSIQLDPADTYSFDNEYINSQHHEPTQSNTNNNHICWIIWISVLIFVFIVAGIVYVVHDQVYDGNQAVVADNRITAVFVAVGRSQQNIIRSIGQFMNSNRQLLALNPPKPNQPSPTTIEPLITKIILACNFTMATYTKQLLQLTNINILQTDTAINMKLLDKILSTIRTPYFYLSTTDWILQQPNYLKYSTTILQKNQKILQVIASDKKQTSHTTDKVQKGFSFKPSLHRLTDYQLLIKQGQGGGQGNGEGERYGLAAVAGGDCQLVDRLCQEYVSRFYMQTKREFYINKLYTILRQQPINIEEQASINTIKNTNFTPNPNKINNIPKPTSQIQNINKPIPITPPQTITTVNKLDAITAMIKNSQQSIKQKQKQKQLYFRTNPSNPTSISNPSNPTITPISPTIVTPTVPIDNSNNMNNILKQPPHQQNKPTPSQPQPQAQAQAQQQSNPYIKLLLESIKQAPKITTLQTTTSQPDPVYKQLPFCLIIMPNPTNEQLQQILTSIKSQQYTNYKIINLAQQQSSQPYHQIQQQIKNQCQKNSILLFINHTIQSAALQYLNKYHQQYRTYFTYSRDPNNNSIEIYSMLARVYELLWVNDFQGDRKEIKRWNLKVIAVAVVELARDFGKLVDKNKVVDIQSSNPSAYFSIYLADQQWTITPRIKPYQKLVKLSQDHPILPQLFLKSTSIPQKSPQSGSITNITHMQYAIQRQQIPYLPQPHLISQIQHQYFNQYYNITQYSSQQQQERLCLTVISHNNVQNNRYKKLVQSIYQQVYTNYHVVFIDDFSTDDNMEKTFNQFMDIGFDMTKIVFVKNKVRNYATYNIINAAYTYCKEDQIQVMIDGDDELIGRYALQVINSVYRSQQDVWIVYSNYKTSEFTYGLSRKFTSDTQHVQNNKRKPISYIGPIRTWKVKLICHIPMFYHQMKNGKWLDTVSDDAIQHPLVQLATVKRVRYINQIMYEYNVKYGDNDDSSPQKVKYRKAVYWELLKLKPLEPLESLDKAAKKAQIQTALRNDRGVKYETYII